MPKVEDAGTDSMYVVPIKGTSMWLLTLRNGKFYPPSVKSIDKANKAELEDENERDV